MKTYPTKTFLFGLAALVAAAFLLGGCGTTQDLIVKPGTVEVLRPATTNLVTITSTNFVTFTNMVDGVASVTTAPVVTSTVQPIILPALTFTNQELTSLAQNTITAAGTAGAVAGVPFSGLIANALLAVLGIALTWLNQRAKRKLLAEQAGHKETAQALALAEDVGKTLVQNLEQLRKTALTIPGYTPAIDANVMTVIQKLQEAAGVKFAINELVDAETGYTKTEVGK